RVNRRVGEIAAGLAAGAAQRLGLHASSFLAEPLAQFQEFPAITFQFFPGHGSPLRAGVDSLPGSRADRSSSVRPGSSLRRSVARSLGTKMPVLSSAKGLVGSVWGEGRGASAWLLLLPGELSIFRVMICLRLEACWRRFAGHSTAKLMPRWLPGSAAVPTIA